LSIQFDEFDLLVSVQDDGKGFRMPVARAGFSTNGHFGLLGMYERAELIGAALEISSEPGQGTVVSIHILG
jgi:signal transduction histidine kinase